MCMVCTSLLLSKIPNVYYSSFDSINRGSAIDGLRGILAFSVLLHHFYCTYLWKTTGNWDPYDNKLINNFGSVPVSLFFLITGYLFLSKLIKSEDIDWKKLYISRIRRIMPLYIFTVVIIVFTTILFVQQSYSLNELLRWASGYIVFKSEGFKDYPSMLINAGVQWSLLYEWGFYFALPIVYLVMKKKKDLRFLIPATIIFFLILLNTNKFMYILFILSFLSVKLDGKFKDIIKRNNVTVSCILLLLFVVAMCFMRSYYPPQMMTLTVIFILIVNGCDFFGLLNNKGLKILGDVSYSTYLLHGIVLFYLFTVFDFFNLNDIKSLYLSLPIVFVLTTIFSIASYLFIERPFYAPKNLTPRLKNETSLQ